MRCGLWGEGGSGREGRRPSQGQAQPGAGRGRTKSPRDTTFIKTERRNRGVGVAEVYFCFISSERASSTYHRTYDETKNGKQLQDFIISPASPHHGRAAARHWLASTTNEVRTHTFRPTRTPAHTQKERAACVRRARCPLASHLRNTPCTTTCTRGPASGRACGGTRGNASPPARRAPTPRRP